MSENPGILLPCPRCNNDQARMTLHLETGDFTCEECDEEITLDEVRLLIAKWQPIVKWVEQMPS